MGLLTRFAKPRVAKPTKASSSWREGYNNQILQIEHGIELYYFVAASGFSWLLLAGYLVSPASYASLQQTDVLDDAGDVAKSVFGVVRNIPLLWFASFACLIATIGLACISVKLWRNCIWVKRYVVG